MLAIFRPLWLPTARVRGAAFLPTTTSQMLGPSCFSHADHEPYPYSLLTHGDTAPWRPIMVSLQRPRGRVAL